MKIVRGRTGFGAPCAWTWQEGAPDGRPSRWEDPQ
jgi:hypothetical protein